MYVFIIKGVVQGVGFRPFIYNQCQAAGLKGYVQNIGDGVRVVVNDAEALKAILADPPPLARIDSYTVEKSTEKADSALRDFTIRESIGEGTAEIPPDLFLCEDCLRELEDPQNRRYGYFFITCTNCGPRYTISTEPPYDRKTTSMDDFPMCPACKEEYTNPADRRYHAQTIACHDCGPTMLFIRKQKALRGDRREQSALALQQAVAALKRDEVVAVKGVGGFHLACRTTPRAVQRLRKLTGRAAKPFALMCRDVAMARRIASISAEEEALLMSVQRPIVLVKKREADSFLDVSELDSLGIMLPYTGSHYLLFHSCDEPLVMTSANMPGEPITTTVDEQFVPLILTHNRRITRPVDDSIVKVIEQKPLLIRRSRGFVPESIKLAAPYETREEILAVGAEMNSAFCITKRGRALLSPYLGNTANSGSFARYKKTLEEFLTLTRARPRIVLADKHPGYATSAYAQELARRFRARLVRIQHHRAHAFSVAAEHELREFLAIVCDGLGWGDDDTIWGGEVFLNDERVGHLEAHTQLGGDAATREPARMLFSILEKAVGTARRARIMQRFFSEEEQAVLSRQLAEQFNSIATTSCGRVLDAAAVFLGLCTKREYDGRPAMLLEAAATQARELAPIVEGRVLLTSPLFSFLVEQSEEHGATQRDTSSTHKRDEWRGELAATVFTYLARGLYALARSATDAKLPVVFGGGCAYNRFMTAWLCSKGVLVNNAVPAGDGGIAFGQVAAYLANARNKNS